MNTVDIPRKQTNLHHLLEDQARDLYNAETNYNEFLSRLALASNDADLAEKFECIKKGTADNISTLRQICDSLGVPPTGVKCEAMAGLLREAKETDEDYAHSSLKDAAMIANAQRIAHYEIAGFGTARAYAKRLNLDTIADQFEEMAEQSGDIDKKLTKIAIGSWLSSGINDDAV